MKSGRLFIKTTFTPGRLFGRGGNSAEGANFVIYGIYRIEFFDKLYRIHILLLVFFNENVDTPIFRKGKTTPSETDEVVNLLRDTSIDNHPLVCTATPVYVDKNVEFLVNSNKLLHWRDVKCDMDSGLTRTKTKVVRYTITENGYERTSSNNKEFLFEARRYIYRHRTHDDFHKVIIGIWQPDNELPEPLFYIQYYFDRDEHEIEFSRLHGNSKVNNRCVKPTNFSLRESIRKLSSEGLKGKAIFSELSKSAGSFEMARSSANFPSSKAQIYDIARKSSKVMQDEVVELIDMCQKQSASKNAFLREVRTAPELSLVLATDRQLHDVLRFSAQIRDRLQNMI